MEIQAGIRTIKMEIKSPKKLIEVALPLDDINIAAAKEKSIRHGHPSTLHLWWARRPLAAARAVIFAQMVNDPGFENGSGFQRGMKKEKAAAERERLFKIIKDLVQWENTNNEQVLQAARDEIWKSWRETCALNKNHPQAAELFNPEKLPAFHDPFAGGGALPLEAQRLGLESYASDLNPVAVTINKAMIEIPPRFAGRKPVGPIPDGEREKKLIEDWSGAKGLAEDVRRYGAWMRAEAEKRIGHLYPQVEVTEDMAKERPDLKPLIGQKLTVIAWLWARTVKSPNPAFSHVDVPLASTFILSSKDGKEAYVDPVIEGDTYRFNVKMGKPPQGAGNGTKLARANFNCIFTGSPIDGAYIKSEGKNKRIGARLMAIVAEGKKGRIYLPPVYEHEQAPNNAIPSWRPEGEIATKMTGGNCTPYGLTSWGDLFTNRQLVALNIFSDLVSEAIEKCEKDAIAAGIPDDAVPLDDGGIGARSYAQAVGVYLAFSIDKASDYWSTICTWHSSKDLIRNTFGRQAIPMTWDYVETNPFSFSTGNVGSGVEWAYKALQLFPSQKIGYAIQSDAQKQEISANKIVSTDPPYYDNIGYADLSDFFYVWLRRNLKTVFPSLYATVAVPKEEELIATPYRHGSKEAAEDFFLSGMKEAMHNLAEHTHPSFPVTIYYAFKQSETSGENGTSNTGWETFLQAVIESGFAINGTWPMRTEMGNRMISSGTNALASSIVLVCRKREVEAETIGRREFIRELNAVLPEALDEMTRGGVNSPVAPVDLSQAIIGPGMAIFSKYAAVVEADGKPMTVKTALQLINRFLAEDDFDHDTQFCLHWFEGIGWGTGKYGDADVLARAKGTSVDGLVHAGVVQSSAGQLRLLKWAELPADWNPDSDDRVPVWEALHQLIRALNQDGQGAAGALLARMPARAEPIRALAYRLHTLCERKGWAEEARAYNELVVSWGGIDSASHETGHINTQTEMNV
jgi:putative DNA methylase